MPKSFVWGALLALSALLAPRPAAALPVFAHRYGLTCQACHTEVPHLTAFGEAFLERGYRLPAVRPRPAFPIAVKVQLAYDSGTSGDAGAGPLPKAVVDEVELLTGGAVGTRGSYFVEQYAVDGGVPGRTRDVWYAQRLGRGDETPLTLRAGQFTLPLPLDPETFRESPLHYAIWDQTAGANPFAFFDPRMGVQLEAGDETRGLAATAAALVGHDPGSGLPRTGTDTMATLSRAWGAWRAEAYRYDGARALAIARDRFWREGLGLSWASGPLALDAVYQHGRDAAAGIRGDALRTSGGFVQARRELGGETFALARWDATQDTAFARSLTAGLGRRLARNTRLTVFGTLATGDAGVTRRLASSLLIAY